MTPTMSVNALPVVIVATHGRFGEELVESASMILGPLDGFRSISLLPGMDPAGFGDLLRDELDNAGPGAIVLTDLFGGTPSNVAAVVAGKRGHLVISGVNLPLLIEIESQRSQLADDPGAVEAALAAGRDGIRDITALMKERARS